MASRPDCLLLRNETNLGFVKTVNVAVRHVSTPCFVLLNTDVVVPEGWLERLTAPLAQNSHIASVTPFSNSAVYFSYPWKGKITPSLKAPRLKNWTTPLLVCRR